MERDISIAGGWLGTYRYGGIEAVRRPVRFEASFRSIGIFDAQLDGEILDDCALGAAQLTGQQAGAVVRFTKQYRRQSVFEQTGRVDYAGLVSDDGMVMRGTWQLKAWTHGVLLIRGHGCWEARRQWRENEGEDDIVESASLRFVAAAAE